MTRIELAIDDLILGGVANVDQMELVQAIERELGVLIRDGGTPNSWSEPGNVLNGGIHQVPPSASARVVGGQVARAIYGAGGGSDDH